MKSGDTNMNGKFPGIRFNERGENAPWLTESSRQAFEKRLNCVAEQYQNTFVRHVQFMGAQINVEVTNLFHITLMIIS